VSDDQPFSIHTALARLAVGELLERDESRAVMDVLLAGDATPAQIGAFLMGLRQRGESVDEITGFVEGMRAASVTISPDRDGLLDLCGTGGDGSGTFNISTTAALVVAAAGVPVAKHGNRSASSQCGSADVLEALGIAIDLAPDRVTRSIEELGFGFLFAPQHHPAMRHVGPTRKELRLRTVFNILGPMCNPAGVRHQLVGVFDDDLRATVCSVLGNLGSECVWAVHGEGGLDEVSIAGLTRVTSVDAGGVLDFEILPEDAGLERSPLESLKGGDAAANATIVERILAGDGGPHRDAVLLNAAAALEAHGTAESLAEGAARAAEAIDSGLATELLGKLRKFR